MFYFLGVPNSPYFNQHDNIHPFLANLIHCNDTFILVVIVHRICIRSTYRLNQWFPPSIMHWPIHIPNFFRSFDTSLFIILVALFYQHSNSHKYRLPSCKSHNAFSHFQCTLHSVQHRFMIGSRFP